MCTLSCHHVLLNIVALVSTVCSLPTDCLHRSVGIWMPIAPFFSSQRSCKTFKVQRVLPMAVALRPSKACTAPWKKWLSALTGGCVVWGAEDIVAFLLSCLLLCAILACQHTRANAFVFFVPGSNGQPTVWSMLCAELCFSMTWRGSYGASTPLKRGPRQGLCAFDELKIVFQRPRQVDGATAC